MTTTIEQSLKIEKSSIESSQVQIGVAASRSQRTGAFQLIYRSYLRAELCGPCQLGMRFTPHLLSDAADILVAQLRGEVISTLSLVRDGALGLPLESIYPDLVDDCRQQGRKLAEVSCLADRRSDPARYFGVFSMLARLMVQMAEGEQIDQLLIAVHPRHAKLYCRAMAFDVVGRNRDYPAVNGHPAVPLRLDLDYVQSRRPAIWQRFCGNALPDAATTRQPISVNDREYFLSLAKQSSCPCAAHRELIDLSMR